jgi:hypothetical protein
VQAETRVKRKGSSPARRLLIEITARAAVLKATKLVEKARRTCPTDVELILYLTL